MYCPSCGSDDAWVRGRKKSQQEGYWIRTTVECHRCGSTSEVSIPIDSHDQRVVAHADDTTKLFGIS